MGEEVRSRFEEAPEGGDQEKYVAQRLGPHRPLIIPLIVLGAFLELIFCSPPPIAAVFLGLAVALYLVHLVTYLFQGRRRETHAIN